MAIWDSIEADAASPAVPATMPDAPPMNVFDEIDENDEARKDDQVRTLFDLGLTKDADEHAGVLAVARQTGAPPNLVEMRYPEFEFAARAARFDPRKFRRDNPELALFLVDHPWAAPVINKDEKFAGFKKWLRSTVATYQALSEEPPITKEVIRTPEDQQKFVAEQKTAVAGEMKRIEEAGQTKQAAYQESTLSGIDAFREEWGRGRLRSDINSLGATAMRLDAMAANAELNKAPPDEVARARQRAYDVHKHILEMEQRLGAQPDYRGGLVEQLALEAVNVTASEFDALKGMGAGGLAGAVLAGGGAAIVSKGSPGAIGAAARAGWRLGVPAGAFLSTFDQEAGSAYLDFLRQKDDAGKPMDPAIARGAAVVYGLASASIEVATIGPMLKMFGPIGEAIHSGDGRSFMRSLMQEQTKRALLKRVGAAWAKGSVTEALEEMSQQAAQIGIGHRAQTLSAGTPQSFDWGEAAAQTMEAGATALIGTALGIGAGGAVVHAAQGAIRLEQSKRAGAVVAGLAQLPDSPIARAAPKELAKLLRAETERVGEPVTSVYIDPAQLTRYFQGDKADSDAAARELLGENGPDRIRDAIARQTAEPGGRATLEVPLAEYLEKFGTRGIAEALVPDTTTRAGYLTRRERIELRQRNADYMQQRTQELLAQAEEEPQSPGESALVSALQKQLAATGMGEQKARVSIAQMRAFLETQAADFGVPVDQLFAAKAISIEREGASRGVPATTLAQPEAPTASMVLSQQVQAMTPQQKAELMWLDRNTGLLNRRGFEAMEPDTARPLLAHLSVEGMKWKNKQGHSHGNLLYRAAGRALAAVTQDGAKWGGDFVVPVATAEEGEQVAAKMQAALLDVLRAENPDLAEKMTGLQVTAVTGERGESLEDSIVALGKQHTEKKKGLEQGKMRAERGARPLGVPVEEAERLRLPTAPAVLRAVPDVLSERAAEMSDEEIFDATIIDPDTGLLTHEGFFSLPSKKYVIAIDLNGLKKINDEYGTIVGDAFLRLFAREAKAAGASAVDLAHLSGDEYAAQTDDLHLAQEFLDKLGWVLQNVGVPTTSGEVIHGISFGYGIGQDYDAADSRVQANKDAGIAAESLARRDRIDARRRGDLPQRGEALSRGTGPQVYVSNGQAASANAGGAGTKSGSGGVNGLEPGPGNADAGQGAARAEGRAAIPGRARGASVQGVRSPEEVASQVVERVYPASKHKTGRTQGKGFGSKASAWDTIMAESLGSSDESPSEQADSAHRKWLAGKGPKPPPFPDGTFDAVNVYLDLKGAERVTGAYDAWDRLTRNAQQESIASATSWAAARHALAVLNQVPGLEKLHLPEGVIARMTEELADTAYDENGQRLYQPAWHGTPHRGISRFLLDKIGTGQAAQSFGHGLYFAEKQDVAEFYRSTLAGRPSIKVDGREVWGPNTVTVRSLEEDGQTTALSRLAMAANMPAVMGGTTRPDAQETIGHLINELMQSLAVNQDHLDRALAAAHGDEQASRVKSAKKTLAHLNEQLRTLQDLRGRNVEFVAAGQTYKANVPENDVLLDYDRAIADQPEHVKDALRRLGIDEHRVDVHVRGADANDVYVFSGMKQAQEFAETERRTEGRVVEVVVRDDESPLTGRDVYESLAKDLGSDREASAALLKEGVPGLRYLDQGSRSQHEGTHNFVIWDEDAIQVLDTLYQGRVPATDTPEFRIWFGSSKVVDENGVPKVVYHGAKRRDRIGARFRKSRATSGPMAFFTDSPELVSKYAEGKADTSLEAPEDYAGWFKYKAGRSTVDISRAWWFLSPEKRAEVGSKLPHVERDEATGAFRLGEGYGLADKGHWEYEIQAARGNVLKAAVETWLNSAGLFDEEEEFLKVLKLAGLEDVEFDSPWTEYPSVFPVYLSIQNPLVTSEIPDGVVRALEKASRRQRSPGEKPGLDPWHKSARDPRDWVQQLKSDLAGGVSSFVWTSIPDWVTKTLKGLGYDGIQDTGGKKGGQEHVVWIPFEETQVKSASGNRGTFDPHNPNILKQGDSSTPRGWVDVAKQGVTKTFRVFLSKEADLSTFLHESSHIYLEMLGDLAAREDAPERVRQTYSDALAWLGVKSRGEITTEHHEKWASAFEAYLREGKAPSSKLAEVFEEFRIWLREIYKSLGMLRVTPNDEIRSVFSRMLATDWEIAAAQESMGADKLIPDGVLSPEQHQAYLRDRERISAEAARKLRAARAQEEDRLASKAWRDEVAANVEKAEAEYEKRQDHRAALFLRSGELVDANGRRLESLGDAKLSSDVIWEALKPDRKSIDQAKRLLRGRLSPRGEDFTWVATDVLGFKDVREMLRAFLVLPERAAWVKERAEDMALEAHPEVAEARERAHEEMIRALHDEGSTDSLLKEWAAMRARGGVPGLPPAEAIKAAARELVAKRPVSWLMSRPYLLLEQERRAAERAVAHAAKGDFAAAADAKKAQLLAHYEYREVEEGIEERERFEALVKKLNDAKARARMGVAGADFRRTADRILVAIGARDQEPAQEGSEPKPAWAIYRDLEQMDITPAFSPEELESVLAQGRPWREMPLTEIRQIRQILAQLYAAAREQNMVMLEGKRVALAEVAHAIGTEARALPDKGPLAASESAIARKWLAKNRIRTQSGTMAVQDFLAGLTEPKVMMDELGPTATKTLWHGYLAARTAEDELAQSVAKFFAETWDRLPKAMQRSRFDLLTDLDGVPFPADLNREGSARDRQWMWMVALNMGNASNMTRLLGGYKWDEATVRAWLDRNMTKEEWDFVQGVWDLLDKELYPKVAAQYERVNGIAPEKIAPVEFQTKWGIYRGGYFPARYDPVASRLGQNQAQEALTTLYAQKAGQYSVAKSFTKGRAEKYSDVVRLEWGIVPSHIGQVIHYVTHDQFLRDAAKIINNAEFSTTVQRRLGAKYMPQVQAWLRTVASSQADAMPEELSGLVRPFQAARSRFVMTTLGYSLSVAAGDLTNPLVAAAAGRIKARYMTPALLRAIPLATYGATRRAALEKSPELRRRSMQLRSNLMRQLSDVGRRGARGAPARIVEAIRESSWFLMEATDRLGSTIIWEGAYRQAIARDGVSEAQAIQEADSAVQDFLPSHDPGDLPTALRDKRFIGSMVVFYSYFSKLANIGRRTMKPAFDEWDNAEGFGATLQTAPTVAAAAGRYLAVLLVASVLGEFLSGRGPDDDEEVPEWVLRKLLASPGFLVPFFGPALEVGVNTGVAYAFHGEARWRPFSMRGSPSGAAMEVLVRSLANAADSDRDGDQRLWDLLALVGFGANLGIGSNQVTRTGRYMTGEEGFRDDFAQGDIPGMLGGAIYGDRPNQPANPASVFSTP